MTGTGTPTQTQTWTTGVTTIALLVLRTGELKIKVLKHLGFRNPTTDTNWYFFFFYLYPIWATSNKKVPLNICKNSRFRSSCAKYHPGLCSPFIHSVVANDSVSGQLDSEGPESDCTDAQAVLGLLCPHMPEAMFHFRGFFFFK